MDTTSKADSSGLRAQSQKVAEFMTSKARPLVDTALNPSPRDQALQELFYRAQCWMNSLNRLNDVQDFQSLVTCTRFMLEIAVDIILLASDASGVLYPQFEAWTSSARFKAADEIVRFFARQGRKIPDTYEDAGTYVLRSKADIDLMRGKYWSKQHPSRWTKRTLDQDCLQADQKQLHAIKFEMNMTLEQFYRTEIPRINWFVHGSGLAAVHGLSADTFGVLCGLACYWSSNLGVLLTKQTLVALGYPSDLGAVSEEWDRLREQRLLAFDKFTS